LVLFLNCSVINSCCTSVNFYVVGLQKQCWKNVKAPEKLWNLGELVWIHCTICEWVSFVYVAFRWLRWWRRRILRCRGVAWRQVSDCTVHSVFVMLQSF